MGNIPGLKYSTTSKGNKKEPKKMAITANQPDKNKKLVWVGLLVRKITMPKSD